MPFLTLATLKYVHSVDQYLHFNISINLSNYQEEVLRVKHTHTKEDLHFTAYVSINLPMNQQKCLRVVTSQLYTEPYLFISTQKPFNIQHLFSLLLFLLYSCDVGDITSSKYPASQQQIRYIFPLRYLYIQYLIT